jgi:hypothetical protein
MAHGPVQGIVHGGPTTMASHRAQRSLVERSLRSTVAHQRWRNGESISGLTGHGRQCGSRATVVKKRRRRHSVWAVLGHGEKRRRAGRGAVKTGWGITLL